MQLQSLHSFSHLVAHCADHRALIDFGHLHAGAGRLWELEQCAARAATRSPHMHKQRAACIGPIAGSTAQLRTQIALLLKWLQATWGMGILCFFLLCDPETAMLGWAACCG
jgi:hypothetical protein